MTHTNEESRKRFETAARQIYPNADFTICEESGLYVMAELDRLHEIWQARDQEIATLQEQLAAEQRMSNCDKLDRERATKRHWQGRAETAESKLQAAEARECQAKGSGGGPKARVGGAKCV